MRNKKKIIIIVIAIVLFFAGAFGIYVAVHNYKSDKLMNRFISDYSKYHKTYTGSYTKTIDDTTILGVIKPKLFNSKTNLYIMTDNVVLFIWVSMDNLDDFTYGLTINDEENNVSHQIELDKDWNAIDSDSQNKIDECKDYLVELKKMIKDEWNIDATWEG